MSFRFSPRDNRANEIAWSPWTPAAFERASDEKKPILLSISAVWCHWCHVMDETSYSDPDVIALINERFIPVRVDNDERPDINARYNMGGWPTTAFLTPDGKALTGATYLPPEQMRRALADVATYYREHADDIAQQPDRSRMSALDLRSHNEPLDDAVPTAVLDDAWAHFDAEHGGFGDAPKFPHIDLLEFLLQRSRGSHDGRAAEMLVETLRGMSNGGTYDHVEGGFFRYSTTRDWSVPHFEKMAEDHAGLLRTLAGLVIESHDAPLRATLHTATHYIRTNFYDPTTHFFAGSQDADEEYFALDAQGRAAHGAPYIDRTSYTNWTLDLASAFFACGTALDDSTLTASACATLDGVHDRLRDEDGLLFHVLRPGEAPCVRGLLTDQVAYLRALLDGYEVTGESRFLSRAQSLAALVCSRFLDETGAASDHLAADGALGRLALADHPLTENGRLALALLRLGRITQTPQPAANGILRAFAPTAGKSGIFAAALARAIEYALAPNLHLALEGPNLDSLAPLRTVALRLRNPFIAIATNLHGEGIPRALPCVGTACGAPITDPAKLGQAFEGR